MSAVLEPTKLELVVQSSGVESESALAISTGFSPFFVQAQEWQAKVATVTDPKVARASRLVLRKIRLEATHKKDELKESVLKVGRTIDAAFRLIEDTIAPMEETLDGIEKAAARAEAARITQIKADREAALSPYNVVTTFFDLANMPAEVFAELLSEKRTAHEAKLAAAKKAEGDRIAAEKKAEADRIERERLAAEERERQRAENERLKKEAAEREQAARIEREKADTERKRLEAERIAIEAKAKKEREFLEAKAAEERRNAEAAAKAAAEKARKEREAIEAKAKAEREAREKLEAENRAREEADAKRKADEEAARKKAERAPDREKLAVFAEQIRALQVPALTSHEAVQLATAINLQVEKFALWVESKAAAL